MVNNINIPNKQSGEQFTADEFNLLLNGVNSAITEFNTNLVSVEKIEWDEGDTKPEILADVILGTISEGETKYVQIVKVGEQNVAILHSPNNTILSTDIEVDYYKNVDNHIDGNTNKVFTGTEKTKLSGIAVGANNYEHPANHPPSIITQDLNNRFVTDSEKSTWNNKSDFGGSYNDLTDKPSLGYGRLYTWAAAVRVAASIEGWHLPSDAEWTQLETYLTNNGYNYDGTIGGTDVRYKIGKSMASINNWAYSSAEGVVGNTDYPTYRNKSGLTLQPGGMRYYSTTNFLNLNYIGYWWTSISDGSFMATTRYIMHTQKNIIYGPLHKNNAVSVRLIKDTP